MLQSYPLIWLLAFTLHPSLFWFSSGVIFCLIEVFVAKTRTTKYKLVPLIMGVISLILALLLLRGNLVPPFKFQIAYWMVLSTASVIWVRPMLLKRKKFTVPEATEAHTLTEILPGETGRVLYEGTSWPARCEAVCGAIAPKQKVYVVRREENTLIVVPEKFLRS